MASGSLTLTPEALVEADRADVVGRGDRAHSRTPLGLRLPGEVVVEPASEPGPTVILSDFDEVDVRGGRLRRRDESDQEGGQPLLVLDDAAGGPQKLSKKSRGTEALTERPHQSSTTAAMRS